MTMPTECRKGHPYTPENTGRGSKGARECLTCKRARAERMFLKRKNITRSQWVAEVATLKQIHRKQDAATMRIFDELCTVTRSPPDYILSDVRWRDISRPRFVAFLALKRLGLSYAHIARFFDRDHSTVMHGVRVAEKLVANDQHMAALLHRLERVA